MGDEMNVTQCEYILTAGIREGTAPVLLSKVTDWDLTAIVQADIRSISMTMVNLDTGELIHDANTSIRQASRTPARFLIVVFIFPFSRTRCGTAGIDTCLGRRVILPKG